MDEHVLQFLCDATMKHVPIKLTFLFCVAIELFLSLDLKKFSVSVEKKVENCQTDEKSMIIISPELGKRVFPDLDADVDVTFNKSHNKG